MTAVARRGPRRRQDGRVTVLVLGQTPPPYGGQSIGIQSLVEGHYEKIRIIHVRMAFSADVHEIGKFRPRKLLHLVALAGRVLWQRLRSGAEVLWYPPAGPNLVPVLRDLLLLTAVRWAFDRTVFHFHAAGVSEFIPKLPGPIRRWAWSVYSEPDLAILTSAMNRRDPEFLRAARTAVVNPGAPDACAGRVDGRPRDGRPVVLYAGVLRRSKGLLVLADACAELVRRGVDFELHLMGGAESPEFERELAEALDASGMGSRATFLGTRTGADKVACFARSDVFCYPTYFESETFGLVLVEAMQCELPVVATRWRGVPTSVEDGVTGFLVPVRDSVALADRLQQLLEDPELAHAMGRRGRELYLERFTEERYQNAMEEALASVADRS